MFHGFWCFRARAQRSPLTSGGPLNWSARGALGSRSSTVRQRRFTFSANDAQEFEWLTLARAAGAEPFAVASGPDRPGKDQRGTSAGGVAPRPMAYGFVTLSAVLLACPGVPAVHAALPAINIITIIADFPGYVDACAAY